MKAIEIIRDRARMDLFKKRVSPEDAERFYSALCPADIPGTYFWEDIDYTDRDKAIWKTAQHYSRIVSILNGFGEEKLSDGEYVKRISGALLYWLEHDFKNPNWWCNEVDAPRSFGNICIMMYPVIDPELKARVAAQIMPRGSMAARPEISQKWGGANLIWAARNTIRHALVIDDEDMIKMAVSRAAEEIFVGGEEGIQEDGSFYQHGPRLYSGGYGLAYINEIGMLSNLLAGTEYQFSPEKLQMLVVPMLDGLKHMMQGAALDYSCIGRNIVRPGCIANTLLKTVLNELYVNPDMPRRDEIKAMIDLTVPGAPRANETKYFPKVQMLSHHFDGIYVGAKFIDEKTVDAEHCNHEGELCVNMSYGTHTTIMRDGYEYIDISPIWDYSRIPGTTSRTENDAELLAHLPEDWRNKPLPNSQSGGKQVGNTAVIYELAEHDGVRALVADFAYEGGFVCLGTDIEDTTDKKEALVTTVEQCHRRGEVRCEDDSYVHNGIRYTALGATKIDAESKTQVGSWYRNNRSVPDEEVKGDVFTLSIKHESGSVSSYAYMISAQSKPQLKVDVIRNDSDVQAIMLPSGKVMAVFHKPSEILVDGRLISGCGIYIE